MDISSICQKLKCNRTELAYSLGVSKSLVTMWAKGSTPISLGRQYQINDLLAGRKPLIYERISQKDVSNKK